MPPAHLDAVHARQADVQHDCRRAHAPNRVEPGRTVAFDLHAVTGPGEVHPDDVSDGSFVLDDEDQPAPGGIRHAARVLAQPQSFGNEQVGELSKRPSPSGVQTSNL